MRRFLCLYLPRWPLQCLHQRRPELRGQPVALYRASAHGPRLTVCSVEANRLGVKSGLLMADAKALSPDLQLVETDRAAEDALLERLALWSTRFTPLVAPEACGDEESSG